MFSRAVARTRSEGAPRDEAEWAFNTIRESTNSHPHPHAHAHHRGAGAQMPDVMPAPPGASSPSRPGARLSSTAPPNNEVGSPTRLRPVGPPGSSPQYAGKRLSQPEPPQPAATASVLIPGVPSASASASVFTSASASVPVPAPTSSLSASASATGPTAVSTSSQVQTASLAHLTLQAQQQVANGAQASASASASASHANHIAPGGNTNANELAINNLNRDMESASLSFSPSVSNVPASPSLQARLSAAAAAPSATSADSSIYSSVCLLRLLLARTLLHYT